MGIIGLNAIGLDGNVVIKRGVSGVTINNQDKVVDITENGTTEVVADGGYTGLGKVTINTEVSGGGESSWRYFDCKQTPIESREENLVELQAMLIKTESLSLSSIMSAAMMKYPEDPSAIVAFGVDMSIEVNFTGEFTSLGQLYEMATDILAQAGIVEITKEQFYDLNA